MGWPTQTAIQPLLPAFGLAVVLPIAIRAVLPEEEIGDFAMAGLGLGCAVLAARSQRDGRPIQPGDPIDSVRPQEGRLCSTSHPGRDPTASIPISLFWIVTVTLSFALGIAARRTGTFCLARRAST